MVETSASFLFLHGSVVLLAGLLSGTPFWLAIIRGRPSEAIRAWRVAHSTLIADGLVMLVVGLLVPHLALPEFSIRGLAWAFVSSGYGFVFALAVGAWTGHRGLTPKPYGMNTLFFLGHVVGAVGSFAGMGMVFWGLFKG